MRCILCTLIFGLRSASFGRNKRKKYVSFHAYVFVNFAQKFLEYIIPQCPCSEQSRWQRSKIIDGKKYFLVFYKVFYDLVIGLVWTCAGECYIKILLRYFCIVNLKCYLFEFSYFKLTIRPSSKIYLQDWFKYLH